MLPKKQAFLEYFKISVVCLSLSASSFTFLKEYCQAWVKPGSILVMVEEAIFTNIVHILPAALPRVTLAVQVCVGDIFSVCVC